MQRAVQQTVAKQRIGATAASLVRDGSTIIITGGTTTAAMVSHLSAKTGLTVITNALNIANLLAALPDIDVVVLGGWLRHSEQTLLGHLTTLALQDLRADQVFHGVFGLNGLTLYEAAHGQAAQGCIAAEYRARANWSHLAISRTGQTTELVEAMRRARAALLCGATDSRGARRADVVLPLAIAAKQGIIQTSFITAAALALRLLTRVERVVFLGRGWRYALALAVALNLQETTLAMPESHQAVEYQHRPIATDGARTLVWCYDALDDALSMAVLDHVQQTGATVRWTGDDPLVALVQAQFQAMHVAISRGVQPDAPRHFSRAIMWPTV